MNLFTITTNSFNTYQVLSNRTQDELEQEYYKVDDNGEVTDINKTIDKVTFKHQGWEKSLDWDRLIDEE